MLLMGMAVGVDYSLFYLKREREERRAGHADPLGRAAATSGRAVLASGITVLIAMAGMLLSGTKVFDSIGVGAILVVFTAMVGSLTVLPALLGRLGDKVEKGKLRTSRPTSRVWDAVLGPVLRFPKSAALLASAGLIAAGAAGAEAAHHAARRGRPAAEHPDRDHLREDPEGVPGRPDAGRGGVQEPRRRLARGAGGARRRCGGWRSRAAEPANRSRSPGTADRTVANVEVPLVGSGENQASMDALQKLRSQVLPASLGRVPGASWAVTGETAGTRDFNDRIKQTFPLVFAFILGLAFLLLLVAFRSVVIPLSSIALNLLSVGAAYGVLVWIFQDGHLQGLLGFHSNGAVVTWLPLFLFAVLFGLSMDYHVFIVSRIKELHDDGLTTAEAVSRGIRSTAGTVTAAAAVMVAVFAIFASLPTLDIKELGVGLAVAVLLDATVIRGVLLPATMKVLGEWNWYLPRWLGLAAARQPRGGRRAGRRPADTRREAWRAATARRGRLTMGSLARELAAPATYRRLGFVLSAFVLGHAVVPGTCHRVEPVRVRADHAAGDPRPARARRRRAGVRGSSRRAWRGACSTSTCGARVPAPGRRLLALHGGDARRPLLARPGLPARPLARSGSRSRSR